MRKDKTITIEDIAKATYHFEESLNKNIFSIGTLFHYLSQNIRKRLHTGHWRSYVFIIFSTIILFILAGFWFIIL